MFKDKLSKMKERIISKNDGADKNKKLIENLVFFVIILIVTIVIINYIWNKDSKKNNSNNSSNSKTLASNNINNNTIEEASSNSDNIENKLETILSNIKGVGKVKVLVTYSQTSQVLPMYSEDSSKKTTEETDTSGGKRTINEDSSKKDIVYEENNGVKTPITQSVINPTIEGAIITAEGASTAEIKSNIIQAVEAATGLATHKIQVFEMNK